MVRIFTLHFLNNFFSVQCKKSCFLLVTLFLVTVVAGQEISFSDLLHFANAGKRFDPLIKGFGFRNNGVIYKHDTAALVYDYFQEHRSDVTDSTIPEEVIFKQILKYKVNNGEAITYKTSLITEDVALKQDLKNEGFSYTAHKNDFLFQKGNVLVNCNTEVADTSLIYTFNVSIKQLPKAKDIAYAEDLFQLTSHEYLSAVFGAENVRKDLFYLPGNKATPCTVIFPNTKFEAVFVWEDGPNYRNILALRIGGDPKTKSSAKFQRSIEQNIWQSREGVYIGMSIIELKKLSERNIVSSNSFKSNAIGNDNYSGKMGLLLGCMNCGDAHYLQADYSNFSATFDEGQKIYISTIILAGNQSKTK
ncbi:MAG TPA: hypothetical protein VGO09_10690 [Flavisolibacter sp.]|nr:hypothetical protein [Flavisolibacter sp.]